MKNSQPMTLDLMVGKSWIYEGKVFRILEIDKLHVVTDMNGGYRFTEQDDLDFFLSNLKEAPPAGAVVMVNGKGDDIMAKLMNGLVDDFERLEKDKEYVHQAKQRSNQVNTAINLAKLRLQMSNGK